MDNEDRVEAVAFRPGPVPVGFATRAEPRPTTIAPTLIDLPEFALQEEAYKVHQEAVDRALGRKEFANEWIKERHYEQAMTNPALAALYGYFLGVAWATEDWETRLRALLEGGGL